MHQTFLCVEQPCKCPCDRCVAEAHNPETTEAQRKGAIALLANDAAAARATRYRQSEPAIMGLIRDIAQGHLTGVVQRAREIMVDVEIGGVS